MSTVNLHRRAEKGLRGLSSIERKRALSAIRLISKSNWNEIANDRNLHLILGNEDKKLYTYRSSPKIRLILSYLGGNSVQIEDIVSHDALQRYFNWGDE